ncbi:YdiU family protein [Conexibacter sp. SYSU D00693]|uniref:protein adenylyltransferase SelO n=1 Tax=Conexibacter sp. SYSU D00693 TaxID=2812560 RepID=UPI00196BAF31|nr:YdiU family protein [Conexibacter sp. SYSU D00693]
MATAVRSLPTFENTYARALEELVLPWRADEAPNAQGLLLNAGLARELGFDVDALATPEGVQLLIGHGLPEEATPVAMAYAGHQFGGYSPRLGDGRALLLGEVVDASGQRRDLHLKGSGRTPFARGGDGKAAVGPMLREYLVSEAMHALGIPTTRSLAVVATGEEVVRETMLPGAVLSRVAASHIRVGTFQYALRAGGPELVKRLADYAIDRHYPEVREAGNPYLAFFDQVLQAQASLVARWMLVGFVHGVMNTDNMAISGETIDYGPCAFMDAFDPATVFSSIDQGGRYAFGNQPTIATWNLARLAECLVTVVDEDHKQAIEQLTAVLETFPVRFHETWLPGQLAKLGIAEGRDGDDELINALLKAMHDNGVDHTSLYRALATALRGDDAPVRALFVSETDVDEWLERWRRRLDAEGRDVAEVADAMDRVNPIYVPRNHLVEDALAMATAGDMSSFSTLLHVVSRPFEERPGLEDHAKPAADGDGPYVTYCGT